MTPLKPEFDFGKLPKSVWFERDPDTGIAEVRLIDQTRLPMQGDILSCRTLEEVELAIRTLAVRGAPALGIAGVLALAVWTLNESAHTENAEKLENTEKPEFLAALDAACKRIVSTRPTAINLRKDTEELVRFAHLFAPCANSIADLKEAVVAHALAISAFEKNSCLAIGEAGAALLPTEAPTEAPAKARLLTICNTGALATSSIGTALGVAYTAYAQGKLGHVWVCETRPVNQGSRLTVWELATSGLPYTLIADSMAASVMAKGWVDAVFVGADRVCANGDSANKIGTLNLAVLAKHYGIPFYVCAPTTSIDAATRDSSGVPIEQRDPRELAGFTATGIILPQGAKQTAALDMLTDMPTDEGSCELNLRNGQQLSIKRKGGAYAFDAWFASTPPGVQIYNPSFDVTPAELITGIITENGLALPPYDFS